MTKRILVLLIGNIRYDGRVKKEISSLQKFCYDISLVVTSFDEDDSFSNYDFKIYVVNQPSGTNIMTKISNKLKYRRSINKIISKEKPDYIHCNDATIFYVGRWMKKVKVIYDAHELLTEMEYGIRRRITTYLEKQKLKNVNKVILPQIDRLNYFYFTYQNQVELSQLYLLENFPLKNNNLIPEFFKTKYDFETDNKILSYVGVIAKERKIIEIIEAVSRIENLVFFIIGRSQPAYKKKILDLIKIKNLEDRVIFKDSIPNGEVISVSVSSDIGICFYSDLNLNSYFCASNKLYENLNSGMAVLTNNIAGTARIIRTGINGYMVDEISVDEIHKGLLALTKIEPPERANYYWENQENVLKEVYS